MRTRRLKAKEYEIWFKKQNKKYAAKNKPKKLFGYLIDGNMITPIETFSNLVFKPVDYVSQDQLETALQEMVKEQNELMNQHFLSLFGE